MPDMTREELNLKLREIGKKVYDAAAAYEEAGRNIAFLVEERERLYELDRTFDTREKLSYLRKTNSDT